MKRYATIATVWALNIAAAILPAVGFIVVRLHPTLDKRVAYAAFWLSYFCASILVPLFVAETSGLFRASSEGTYRPWRGLKRVAVMSAIAVAPIAGFFLLGGSTTRREWLAGGAQEILPDFLGFELAAFLAPFALATSLALLRKSGHVAWLVLFGMLMVIEVNCVCTLVTNIYQDAFAFKGPWCEACF
jgi:hypothetical protein